MSKRILSLLVLVLTFGLLVAACGDDETGESTNNTSGSTSSGSTELTGTDFGAAELRATLTAGLEEHLYLAGIALVTGAGQGFDSDQFTAAADALDKNSVGLSEAIGSVYGDEAEAQFLEQWRQHITDFVEYTQAAAAGDAKGMEENLQDLDGYRAAFGQLINSVIPELDAKAVADELKPHVASVIKVIDTVASGEGDPFEELRQAASHMPNTAAVLSGAIAQQNPDDFAGDADSPASELRATMTAGLEEHVYLAGVAIVQGVSAGLDSPEFELAAAALDKNSVALSEAIGSVYGDEAEAQFLEQWRQHITDFVEYTAAKAEGDEKGIKENIQDLDGYRAAFGEFIAGANPELTAEAVADELKPHVESVLLTIDTLIEGGDAYEALRQAATHMPNTALVLSNAIAVQMPEEFPATVGG